jgi:ATP-binding cassette subfamily A (ABC1) protein 3
MLKEQKKDRIIVLTTHYMDEADILGDRIGIMASGKMTALGSSMFLKSKFGVGYNLVAIKSDSNQNPAILEYFTEHLGPKVCKQSEIQSELTLTIPIEYADKFGVFFKDFDRALASLNIRSYGISISTLEEVFLKVGHLEDPSRPLLGQSNELKDLEKGVDRPTFNLQTNLEDLDNSFSNNLFAVLFKRYANYKRNKKAILNEAIIPALVILGGIGLT